MIFCTIFCGRVGIPGKFASGLDITPGAAGGLGEVLLMGEAVKVVVSGMLEAMEGRRRGPVGGEGNTGKPSADTSGGGGGSVSEDMPGI